MEKQNIITNSPLYRDPVYDGAADPAVIWNREEGCWWMVYTNRRVTSPGAGFAWVHGTDIGVASSKDGEEWKYRGVLEGLDIEKGRNTFWAPEIIFHNHQYHMYVSYIQGVPDQWAGHERNILHYTSRNLWDWKYQSTIPLSSSYVIDAAIHPLPGNRWRMWYKDEKNNSHTYAADSEDLYEWKVVGPIIEDLPHEGVNVFFWRDFYWMIIDQWNGQGVYRSNDGEDWERNGAILDESGIREDDTGYGYHADVLVNDDQAYIYYFTHPDRTEETKEDSYQYKRSVIQVAILEEMNGKLQCNRNMERA